MTEDQNKTNKKLGPGAKPRKTLTLKLSKGAGSAPAASKTPAKSSAYSSNASKVVVVNKSSKGGRPGTSEQGAPNLQNDLRRKLDILKNASDSRGSFNKESQQSASQPAVGKQVAESQSATEVRKEDAGSSNTKAVEVRSAPVPKQKAIRPIVTSLGSPMRDNRGKMRNLDAIGRKPKAEREAKPEEKSGGAGADSTKSGAQDHRQTPRHQPRYTKPVATNTETARREDEESEAASANKKGAAAKKKDNKKLTIAKFMQMEDEVKSDDFYRPRGIRSIKNLKGKKRGVAPARDKIVQQVVIREGMTVQEIAQAMSEKATAVIKRLMGLGIMATINQSLDVETAEILVSEMGHKYTFDNSSNLEESLVDVIKQDDPNTAYKMVKRSPIVTIMGHVDHGKTSLLDAYRESKVVDGEAGGITQHIAAYQVECGENTITFLDTPGHAAFTAMRLRGAMVTDIVVIIVAADDGIMEQTIEAISHAKAADVPIIVAINKIDKPDADADKVRNQLLAHNLIPEELGGDIMVVEVSAAKKTNLDGLLEAILLQSELLDLNAPFDRSAVGSVVEARKDKKRGVIATLLVKKGELKRGDIVVAGQSWGKVKNLYNDLGRGINSAGPSTPTEIIGFDTTPSAGDEFIIVDSEKQARDIVEYRKIQEGNKVSKAAAKGGPITLENLFKNSGADKVRQLNVLVKSDVHGSTEAIVASLGKIATSEVEVHTIHQGVGGITESDVTLASASDSIIIGFNVRASESAAQMAKNHGVEIRYYSIIYELIDEVKKAASGLLDPIQREEVTGQVDIRDVFNLSKFGKVAGCYVTSGLVKRSSKVRLIRDNVVIHDGEIKALKRFKDDVKEVKSGFECGLSLERHEDIKPGDRIEAYDVIEEKREL